MQTKTRVQRGIVTSDKMDKTIVVKVERLIKHPLYKKYVKQTKKFYAHDETNSAHIGDYVELAETRPLSKTKFWRLSKVLVRSVESETPPEAGSDTLAGGGGL
jgi:small subunit ribosomal protein S17